MLPKKFHDAYHTIFANLTPTETLEFLIWLNYKMWVSKKITPDEIVKAQDQIRR